MTEVQENNPELAEREMGGKGGMHGAPTRALECVGVKHVLLDIGQFT